MADTSKKAWFISVVRVVTKTGDSLFFWTQNESPDPTRADLRKFLRTPPEQRNGPFATPEEAEKAAKLTLFGPDCEIIKAPGWPFLRGTKTRQ